MKSKRKQLSGGAKLKAAGKRAILLGVQPWTLTKLEAAAELEMRPVTQFVLFYAVQAAERVIDQHRMARACERHHVKELRRKTSTVEGK